MMWESSGSGRHGEGPAAPPSAGVGPPHLRPFLWAYPNFDPAQAPLRAPVSPGSTLDDCASWRGARGDEHPPTGSNPFQTPSLPGALPLSSGGGSPSRVFTSQSSHEHFARGVLDQGSGQEQRHDRELQEKTRQLQQQQHWLLDDPTAAAKEARLSWRGDGSGSQATEASPSAPASAAAQLRAWKRTCLQGEAGLREASPLGSSRILGMHPNETPEGEEELVRRRVRRTVGGKKLVEEALPPALGRALDQDQVQSNTRGDLGRPELRAYRVGPWGHGAASAAGSGLGSVSSTPAGESAPEESLQRAHTEPPEGTKRARRVVLRRKRKEAEGLASFASPPQQGVGVGVGVGVGAGLGVPSRSWARECLESAAAAAAAAGESVGGASSQRGGSACPEVVDAGEDESESFAAPHKRSKAAALLTPETACAGEVLLSSARELGSTAEGCSELGEWLKVAEQQSKGTRADEAGVPSGSVKEGIKRRVLLSAPESSSPSGLTNASSLSQSGSCLDSRTAGDTSTGAGRKVFWQGGSSRGPPAGLGSKGSASLPLLSQALSSSSSQCTTSSGVMGGTSPFPPKLGACGSNLVAGFGTSEGLNNSSSMSAFAPLHESRCQEIRDVVEEAEMMEKPNTGMRERKGKEKKKKKKSVEFHMGSPRSSNGNSSGSEDEAAPKFVLSSGRALSAPGRPKKQVTIDDEFESYFAKLLL